MREEYSVFCGTGEYYPPEWYNFGRYKPGPLCVWQLGCLLYILLCGSIPFEKDDIPEAVRDHKYEKHLSWEALDAIDSMLHPDQEKRVELEKVFDLPFFKESWKWRGGFTLLHYVAGWYITPLEYIQWPNFLNIYFLFFLAFTCQKHTKAVFYVAEKNGYTDWDGRPLFDFLSQYRFAYRVGRANSSKYNFAPLHSPLQWAYGSNNIELFKSLL